MIQVGSIVKVVGMPENNNYWNISPDLLERTGVVSVINNNGDDGGRIYVLFGDDRWYFPVRYDGVLEEIPLNKWNKLNYVSPFKPLKLP